MAPRVLILAGDFVEDYEVFVPFQSLLMVGYIVHIAAPGKKAGQKVKTAIHDFEGDATYTEKPGHNVELNVDFDKVACSDYDGLVIPGGRFPEWARLDKSVLALVKDFFAANKPVAAICHGIQILTAAGLVTGRKVTCYPACGPEVTLGNGTYVEVSADEVVEDGNLLTSPAWPSHPKILAKFVKLLGTTITHK
ncbi:peptidase C56, PfpI [Cladochytrium replicatum]|nr:peptidase C56, PfpI [Cladochytrium replicatum]